MRAGTGLAGELGLLRRDDPAAYSRAWRAKNREKSNAYARDYHHKVIKKDPVKLKAKLECGVWTRRKAKYGITKSEYQAMALNQKGLCAICKREPLESLRVDHDHGTGKIRALLCDTCNAGLGQFHDDPVIIASAIEYLNKYRTEGRK